MRKEMWSAVAVVVLLSGAPVLLVPAVEAADTQVKMKDQLLFEPADISVPVGSAVVWHNDGSIQHDAKADDNSFSTPMIDPGKEASVTFKTPGDVKYFCSVPGHKSAGMTGVVHVTAGGATPTTAAPTTTTTRSTGGAAAPAPAGQGATTTTARPAAGTASTTTTKPPAGATPAPASTPTSAPEVAGVTTTTAAAPSQAVEEGAVEGHSSEGGSHDDDKSSPLGIAFAAISTMLLVGISAKLLASKS